MIVSFLKNCLVFAGLMIVASLERVVGLPGWFLLLWWWWVTRLPTGWPRITGVVLAGVWLGALYQISLAGGVTFLSSWYICLSLFPTQSSWQNAKVTLLLIIWLLSLALWSGLPWSWLATIYTLSVVVVLLAGSRFLVLWDQRLQVSLWWKQLHGGN